MPSDVNIARALATAFVAGDIAAEGLIQRGRHLFGRNWRWLTSLARRTCAAFEGRPRPRRRTVAEFLLNDRGFRRACEKHELLILDRLGARLQMSPIAAAATWPVPAIRSAGELAAWLGIKLGELDWLADRRGWEATCGRRRLQHYHYRVLAKRFGQVRLIEAPKPTVKCMQRQILAEILNYVPPHEAAHGFRQGRSIRTFAAPHVGKRVVLRIDLQDFFPSIAISRVQSLFRSVGYPEGVADLLAGICSNSTPEEVWNEIEGAGRGERFRNLQFLYRKPHLPQGAPTSPAIANLCAYRLDCRLAGLAAAAQAVYTRYADDLAFSGDEEFNRCARRFYLHACATIMEEGFAVHYRKTKTMRQARRQQLAGIVVNEKLNVPRLEYDRLKAILTNCIRHGPEGQNRMRHDDFRAHLRGRISFIESVNRERGARLRQLLEQIRW